MDKLFDDSAQTVSKEDLRSRCKDVLCKVVELATLQTISGNYPPPHVLRFLYALTTQTEKESIDDLPLDKDALKELLRDITDP